INISGRIDLEMPTAAVTDACGCRRTAVSCRAAASISRNGIDRSIDGHFSDAVVISVEDIDIERSVNGNAIWRIQFGSGGKPTVATEPCETCTGDSGDRSVGSDLPNAVL